MLKTPEQLGRIISKGKGEKAVFYIKGDYQVMPINGVRFNAMFKDYSQFLMGFYLPGTFNQVLKDDMDFMEGDYRAFNPIAECQ